eukprot:1054062-Rhodomonas_salina.2
MRTQQLPTSTCPAGGGLSLDFSCSILLKHTKHKSLSRPKAITTYQRGACACFPNVTHHALHNVRGAGAGPI